ncbi:chaperone protein dnaJ 6 [Iris pallida]|uniref:Chaperone protein dnaJ 6 n=1 Tax=Iris pallida TaxID=29817 RepID=A0AAX6ES45_IRIPA|nr:chaperone protein dnaJ 6 [Iris pallida]
MVRRRHKRFCLLSRRALLVRLLKICKSSSEQCIKRLQKLILKSLKLTIEDQIPKRRICRTYIQNSKAIWTGTT